jgi:ATP-dependent 26S proteasome regulatory subunit
MSTSTEHPYQDDLSISHLQAEFARLDVLIQREIKRWQLAGQDPADGFRGLYISDDDAERILARPFGNSWGQSIELEGRYADLYREAKAISAEKIDEIRRVAHESNQALRLDHLVDVFHLDEFERDAFLICAAPAIDLRYERIYGYLQDDVSRRRPMINLILDLLCDSVAERYRKMASFSDRDRLIRNRLIERYADPGNGKPGPLNQSLMVNLNVIRWLLGSYQTGEELGSNAFLFDLQSLSQATTTGTPVIPDIGSLEGNFFLAFYGSDQTGQVESAKHIAMLRQRPILCVDLATILAEEIPLINWIGSLLRDALLLDAIVFIINWDACLEDGAPPVYLLEEIDRHAAPVIIGSRKYWHPQGTLRQRNIFWKEFPIPSYTLRTNLWAHFTDGVPGMDQMDLTSLSGQFLLTTGQIRDAVATARDIAAQNNRKVQLEDLFAAARLHSNPRLSSLARKITPRFSWDDIVLPADQKSQLKEIIATVRSRPTVLEQWGLGEKLVSSRGVTVLFAGPPGTGKTMAAEIIASELGLELYKIDLSTVVSKYIGETEKNLERIFIEAEASNAILFFDEADALFGKRSEVRDSHDRYANIEISFLLQRMEAYDGVTILATNLRANLDEAFTRRLQFAVDFPFPEEADRLRIWKTLLPPDLPYDAGIDLELLAKRFKLAGGNIRNILVSAAYLAASDGGMVRMTHLLHGTRRELQKMGRLVGDEDLLAHPGKDQG